MDIAVVNVGARVDLDASGQRIEGARISVGAVAPGTLVLAGA
ncbi:MAG: xanthine dehydrogenase family protein subunit M, partial [Dehalococcoidia bacterium]|nr:xanthine dehydrogenase family protein subunit M [Dehalococcoidia bacterium]